MSEVRVLLRTGSSDTAKNQTQNHPDRCRGGFVKIMLFGEFPN